MIPESSLIYYRRTVETSYFAALRRKIEAKGGFYNAHLHIDRSGTFDFSRGFLPVDNGLSFSALSLQTKHGHYADVHDSPLYEPSALQQRVRILLRAMASIGTTRAATTVDVTDDSLQLSAFEAVVELREELRGTIELEVGAYTPLGFRDDQPHRFTLFLKAAERADFLVGLPERDDQTRYPDHIGFDESVKRLVEIGVRLGKEVHIHVDQENHQFESASEKVLNVLDSLNEPGETRVWLIHVISPSAYDEQRFEALVSRMAHHKVGVIICPSAALSMRQLRPIEGPARNSVARVLEFLASGLPVRLGSDNFLDITSPAGTIDLMAEIFVLANALRFFDTDVLASMGAGTKLSLSERQSVRVHLDHNREEERRALEFIRGQNGGSPANPAFIKE